MTPREEDWRPAKGWPAKPRQVTSVMRRLAPAFRKTGWTVEDLGSENHDKLLRWKISPPRQPEKAGENTRQSPQDPQSARKAGIGGDHPGPSTSVGKRKNAAASAAGIRRDQVECCAQTARPGLTTTRRQATTIPANPRK